MTNVSEKILLAIKEAIEEERERSDRSYAIKLVEVILFSFLGLIGSATVLYIVNGFLKSK